MSRRASAAHDSSRTGTQSIERVITLLREVSARGEFGWQLSDLAARCELSKSTAHRMLTCLVHQRMVRQREGDGHYLPGPMLFELGLSVPGFDELQHHARKKLESLARRTGAVGFLFFRSGDDFACAVRVGKADLKAFTGFSGSRKPLITSAGGAAILLALPMAEARAIIGRCLNRLPGDVDTRRFRALRSMLNRTHGEGFAVNAGDLLPGVNSYALALFDAEGRPFASVMLAAAEHILPLARLPEIKASLQALSKELQAESCECRY